MMGSKFIEAQCKEIYSDNGGDYLQFTTEIWNPSNEMKLTVEEEKEWSCISKTRRKKVKEHT
eukprot:6638756-Ditylum_brightwellii.AAC.1